MRFTQLAPEHMVCVSVSLPFYDRGVRCVVCASVYWCHRGSAVQVWRERSAMLVLYRHT